MATSRHGGPLEASGPALAALGGEGDALRHPRLTPSLRTLRAAGEECDDWRKYPPADIAQRFQECTDADGRTALATAVFVGTAQACLQGAFWSPGYGYPDAVQVDCRHSARSASCLYRRGNLPRQSDLRARSGADVAISCRRRCNTLDACAELLSSSVEDQHVAVVRFTSVKDPRNESLRFGHCSEDQLFLRTSYFRAFERMNVDVNARASEALDEGGLAYTSGVGLLRGPLAQGARWLLTPAKLDVLWVALAPHPQRGEARFGLQDWYANDEDAYAVAGSLDMIFAWASARGCDAVVLPPLGCGTHGCTHPGSAVGSLIHEAARQYRRYLRTVIVASDHPAHADAGWWSSFAEAVQEGRRKPEPEVLVPPIKMPAYLLVKKPQSELLEKSERLHGRARSTPRTSGHGVDLKRGPPRPLALR